VQDLTIVEVEVGLYEGMRGWVRGLLWEGAEDHSRNECYARVELVTRNEPIMVEVPLRAIRPADPQSIGTGEGEW
jgi:hypothetical protein